MIIQLTNNNQLLYIHQPFNWLTLGTASNSRHTLMIHTHMNAHIKHTHTNAQSGLFCRGRSCEGRPPPTPPPNFGQTLSLHPLRSSVQLSVLSCDSEFAALSLASASTCDISTDMRQIILHVIVRQIGGQLCCRQGSVARDTEEMFNQEPAHSGASLFQLLQPVVHLSIALSPSFSLPTAAGLPLGGSYIMAGLIY